MICHQSLRSLGGKESVVWRFLLKIKGKFSLAKHYSSVLFTYWDKTYFSPIDSNDKSAPSRYYVNLEVRSVMFRPTRSIYGKGWVHRPKKLFD